MDNNVVEFDRDLIVRFELGLDPYDLSRSRIPAEVLGYGEVSTVMTLAEGDPTLVYKRMPMFHTEAEVVPYLTLYDAYQTHLAAAGVTAVPASITHVVPPKGNAVAYIIQAKLDGRTLANRLIHHLPAAEIERLFGAILGGIGQVFAYNEANAGQVALGFDAQMSNWAVAGHDAATGRLPEPVELIYIDTSSPLIQLEGKEQLDPELFLRSAPSFLRWVVRLLFLKDVLSRYYDRRQVVIDVLANLHKEKRPDVIPALLVKANAFLRRAPAGGDAEPITQKEVAAYYREDAMIWRVYLSFRRLDRRLQRLIGRQYPYVLPGPIDR